MMRSRVSVDNYIALRSITNNTPMISANTELELEPFWCFRQEVGINSSADI